MKPCNRCGCGWLNRIGYRDDRCKTPVNRRVKWRLARPPQFLCNLDCIIQLDILARYQTVRTDQDLPPLDNCTDTLARDGRERIKRCQSQP